MLIWRINGDGDHLTFDLTYFFVVCNLEWRSLDIFSFLYLNIEILAMPMWLLLEIEVKWKGNKTGWLSYVIWDK